MEMTDALLDRLASLSGLEIREWEREELKEELGEMARLMLGLRDIAPGEERRSAPVEREALREDRVGRSLNRESLLQNAPETDGDYYLVPRTVE